MIELCITSVDSSTGKYRLVVRDHGPVETDYAHVAWVTEEIARTLVERCGVDDLYHRFTERGEHEARARRRRKPKSAPAPKRRALIL